MRNLKRALSLALASVMVLGMMVVGTSAAGYKDVSSEQNQEAIEVLQAVGIMTGDENGNFNPDAKVTRNEMAVIMSNLLNLDYDYYRGVNKFTDVPTWAAPYVAACVAEGVTAGIGNNLYGGDQNVTAAQAALMLMKALGYFQYAEDFGEDWTVATIRQASYISLFDGVKANAETALTRNQVAQMVLNALESDMVEFTGDAGSKIELNGVTVNVGYRAEYTARSSSDRKYDSLVGGSTDIAVSDKYIIQLGEELYDGDLTKKATDDDFGRPSTTWNYKKVEIGTYPDKNDLMGTYTKKVTQGDLYSLIGKSVYDDLKDVRDPAELNVYVDGAHIVVNEKDETDILPYFQKNSSDASGKGTIAESKNGRVTEVYVDDAHNVTVVVYNTYVFQAATDYDSKKETVKLVAAGDTEITLTDATLSADDFDIKDIKADDYLLVTATKDGTRYEVQSVEPAEVITGTVNSYKNESSVTLDGTSYDYSATTTKDAGGVAATQYTVGQTAAVVVDKYGYIIAVDEALVSSNYVFIAGIDRIVSGLVSSAARADAYYTDGTEEEVVIDKIISGNTSITNPGTIDSPTYENRWYTYSKTSDNKIVLLDVETKYSPVDDRYVGTPGTAKPVMYNDRVNFAANGDNSQLTTTAVANDATIAIVRDTDGDITLYTGLKSIPDVELTDSATSSDIVKVYTLKNTRNSYTSYVFVDAYRVNNVSIVGGDESADFTYVVKYDGQFYVDANNTYYTYKVLNDEGKEEAVKFDTRLLGTGDIYNLYYKARVNSDEEITSLPVVPTSGKYFNSSISGAVTYEDGVLTLGAYAYTVASDAEIVLVTRDRTLHKDPDASYVATTGLTAKELAGQLKGWNVTGTIAGATTETSSNKIQTLYITVNSVSAITQTGSATFVTNSTLGANETLYVDGTSVGTLAANLSVPGLTEGTHTYKVSTTQYADSYTGTFTVTGDRTTTITLPKMYVVTDVSGDGAVFGHSDGSWASDGSSVRAFAGNIVKVQATATNTALTSSNVTLTQVTAPAAGVYAEYTFVMPDGAVTPLFTTETRYTVGTNVNGLNGLKITLSSTSAKTGDVVTVTVAGTALADKTMNIGTTDGGNDIGNFSVVETGEYSQTFNVTISADTVIYLTMA